MELRAAVARLPRSPGVYLWKNADEEILYVGKAIDLRARTTSYFSDRTAKTVALMEEAAGIDFIAVRNEKEALVLEQTLIKRHRPRYNVRLTDDKSYPYLKLTNEPYPRLLKVFGRRNDKATYFGPFPDGYGAYHVLQVLNEVLPLRRCKTLPKTKCLYYDIGKCIAPCIDACTDDDYANLVAEAKKILKGNAKDLTRRVRQMMGVAAAENRFEDAARHRDQLRGLEGVLERQHMTADNLQDRDVAALDARGDRGLVVLLHQRDGKIVGQSPYQVRGIGDDPSGALADFLRGHYADRQVPRHVTAAIDARDVEDLEADLRLLRGSPVTVEAPQRGEKQRWLDVAHENARLRMDQEIERDRRRMGAAEALQQALGLESPPRVIEGFDISHHAGAHTRAALVRFVDGEPEKKGYRTFGMRTVGEDAVAAGTAASRGKGREVDDFASMREAVERHAAHGSDPDLLLIDGGRGQLDAAVTALRNAGVSWPLVSIAKREEELFVPHRLHPIKLPRDHPGLQLLQRVRDEAHRFGITQVRRKARAAVARSPLDDVPGIGPTRRRTLMQAFAGLEGLRAATEEDVARVPGIPQDVAKRVVEALGAGLDVEEPVL